MRHIRWPFLVLSCLSALQVAAADNSPKKPQVLVFAAASLTDVLQKIGDDYGKPQGVTVKFSFGSSATLARQIESGAAPDLYISADTEWMDYLEQRSLIRRSTRSDLLGNKLVLVCAAEHPVALRIAKGFRLRAALGESGRLAIADPASVPAGKYARASLTALGVWSSVEDRLASAENVRTALLYVARGEAPLGIVYRTDALSEPKVRIVGEFPESSHAPIVYPVALTSAAVPAATDFLKYLTSGAAVARFTAAGFRTMAPTQKASKAAGTAR